MLLSPASVLSKPLSQPINLIIGGLGLILKTFVLISNHRQLLQLSNQVLVLSFVLLSLEIRLLQTVNFGFECCQVLRQSFFFVIGFGDLNSIVMQWQF